MLGNISTLTINVKSHGWFGNSQQYIDNKTNSRIRNIQQGINIRIKTNSSLYVTMMFPKGDLETSCLVLPHCLALLITLTDNFCTSQI